MMARTGRQLAIIQGAQFAAHRLLGHDDSKFLPNPLAKIDDPPSHDTMRRRNRTALDDRRQGGALFVVQARRRSRRLAIDQALGAVRIELQHPVADDLQRHPADLRRLGPRRAFVDRRQRQQPTSLRPVLRTPCRSPHHRGVKIRPKRYRHGEPPLFATLNQTIADSKTPTESRPAGIGIMRAIGQGSVTNSEDDPPSLVSWEEVLEGERLLDDYAERGIQTWASPIDLLRLLLIRRDPKPIDPERWIETPKVLDLVIPGFDCLVAATGTIIPPADRPILPLSLRPALLAGIAIVERLGPKIIAELHGRTIGAYHAHFGTIAARILASHHPIS